MGRRIDPRVRLVAGPRAGSEPGDVARFGDETGVVRALEGAQAVRLRFVTLNRIRCPEPSEMPMALAIARPSSGSPGAAVRRMSAPTTRAVVSAAIGALPGLRVLSRNKPSTPLSRRKRCCHRHTVGRLTPMLCATCCAECRSAEATTMRRPLPMFARPVAVGHDRRQLLALRCAQNHAYCCAMAPSPGHGQYRISRCVCESSECI
jgi:hypothetical protein